MTSRPLQPWERFWTDSRFPRPVGRRSNHGCPKEISGKEGMWCRLSAERRECQLEGLIGKERAQPHGAGSARILLKADVSETLVTGLE